MLNQEVAQTNAQNKPEPSPANGKIRVKLITPLFESHIVEADSVLLPALDGDILILPDRAPIFFSLRPGRMIVYNNGEEPIKFLISSSLKSNSTSPCCAASTSSGVSSGKITLSAAS